MLFKLSIGQNTDTSNTNLLQPSLDDILTLTPNISKETAVTISNLVEINVNEAPNVISIITDQEIKAMGYRDLLDVLNTIPGINIANDVQNGTSIGIRGIWAEEGRVQFMVNGMVLNDMAYGSIILGHRIQLDNIKRIEIIRGAGSSIYGGLAALGAINIISKTGQEINGHDLIIGAGISNSNFSREAMSYSFGGALLNGVELTGAAIVNAGNRSNSKRMLPDSTFVNFADSSLVNNVAMRIQLKYKAFLLKQRYEDYNFQATYEPISSLMRTSISEISYTYKTPKLSITPQATFKWQVPWASQYGDPKIYDLQNITAKRQSAGANGAYKINDWLTFTFGSQIYMDSYKHHRKSYKLKSGKYMQYYSGYIAYAEATVTTKFLNINVGGRFDKYAFYKPNILPRIGLTKAFKNYHYKLLYGQSFKIPPLQNINLDITGTLVPEKVSEMQAELGYQNNRMEFKVVGFNYTIHKFIIFGFDKMYNESYINSGTINNAGAELEAKIKLKRLVIGCNYSNYYTIKSSVNDILVDTLNVKKGTLAFPKHKVVFSLTYKLKKNNSINLFYVMQTQKSTYERVNVTTDEYSLIQYPATNNINITYQRNGFILKFIDVNVGLYNVLNTKNYYLYPSSQGYAPVFGMDREFFVNFKLNL